MKHDPPNEPVIQVAEGPATDRLAPEPGDPPVVARMIVEIRSDGMRTIARGALEDVSTGHRVALVAGGGSPAALAASLAKSLFKVPVLARGAVRALLRRVRP